MQSRGQPLPSPTSTRPGCIPAELLSTLTSPGLRDDLHTLFPMYLEFCLCQTSLFSSHYSKHLCDPPKLSSVFRAAILSYDSEVSTILLPIPWGFKFISVPRLLYFKLSAINLLSITLILSHPILCEMLCLRNDVSPLYYQ